MASSSDIDAATEALIAQILAEDLGESYDSYSLPIGASYHDYEEPLSSYERQCLDAANDLDGDSDEGCGWDPEISNGINSAVAPDESQSSTESSYQGTWNSRFIDEDGQVQELAEPERESRVAVTDDDDSRSDPRPCSSPTSEGLTGSPSRIVSLPACNAHAPTNPAGETRNIPAPMALPTQLAPDASPGPIQVPHDHIDPSDDSAHREAFIPPHSPAPTERPPASSRWSFEDQWDDGLDYSCYKGKGRAVRAYDEFRLGLRDGERRCREPNGPDLEDDNEQDSDSDSEEESENEDEDLQFIRIPWPATEPDELLSRREDAEVVEIRVGEDETLESILRDISLRDERRRKGKGVEEDEGRGREELLGRNDVVAWW